MSVKYKCKFQENWLSDVRFEGWLQEVDSNINEAFCKVCHKSFSVAGQGVKQVESHMSSEKHKIKCPPNSLNNRTQQVITFTATKDPLAESVITNANTSNADRDITNIRSNCY